MRCPVAERSWRDPGAEQRVAQTQSAVECGARLRFRRWERTSLEGVGVAMLDPVARFHHAQRTERFKLDVLERIRIGVNLRAASLVRILGRTAKRRIDAEDMLVAYPEQAFCIE